MVWCTMRLECLPAPAPCPPSSPCVGDKGRYQTQLFLKPEDLKKAGNASFSHGRFSYVTEKGLTEDTIAASCGQYVINYNFRRCAFKL